MQTVSYVMPLEHLCDLLCLYQMLQDFTCEISAYYFALLEIVHDNIEVLNDFAYVMPLGSGENPELQNTLKNASCRGGRAAN